MRVRTQVADKADALRKGGAAAQEAGSKASAGLMAVKQAVDEWEQAGVVLFG